MASEKTRLFAVIIGINSYKSKYSDLRSLHGAVSDALGFKIYLEDCLNVPTHQIKLLTNENATRSNIIDALKDLRNDERIDKDDAIFLYYAGHGTEIAPPKGRECGAAKIQAIVPYDCDSLDKSRKRVAPIPDYVLEILLSKVVETKGNNITVVFDCCHSASGTRSIGASTEITRGVELLSDAYSEQLNQELLEVETVSRGAFTAAKFRHRELGSHILLSACGATQEAKENNGHGHFSASLLKLLNRVPPDGLWYSEILRHRSFDPISGQDPQCEGLNRNRILFNAKVLPVQRKSFPISLKQTGSGQCIVIVHGGTIHNITLDAEFGVYLKMDISLSTKIGVLHVAELQPFFFTAKLPPNAREFELSQPIIAVQTKFGQQIHLLIYNPPHDGFRQIYNNLMKNSELRRRFGSFDYISRVDESKARVRITSTAKNKLRFTLRTEVVCQVVGGVEADLHVLAWIFSRMADFFRELK